MTAARWNVVYHRNTFRNYDHRFVAEWYGDPDELRAALGRALPAQAIIRRIEPTDPLYWDLAATPHDTPLEEQPALWVTIDGGMSE